MNWYKMSQSKVKLWLDDNRDPKNPTIKLDFGSRGDEIWVKTVEEAKSYLMNGNVEFISFDNDLGQQLEGSDLADWIEELAFNNKIPRMAWKVHSKNPVKSKAITQAMTNADRFWDKNELV